MDRQVFTEVVERIDRIGALTRSLKAAPIDFPDPALDCANALAIDRSEIMTTVQITLPDALAQEAANAGLLDPNKLAALLRQQLRAERIERLRATRATLAAEPLAPMTPREIQAEIDAYRAEQRAPGP